MQWEWLQWRRQWLNWVVLAVMLVFLMFSYGNLQQTNAASIERELALLADENLQLQQLEDEIAQQKAKNRDKQLTAVQDQRRRLQQYATALEQREKGLARARLAYFQGIKTGTSPLSERKKDTVDKAIARDTYLIKHRLVAEEIQEQPTPARFLITIQNRNAFTGLLVILVLQIAGVFSSDWEKRRYRLLYTLPHPRWQLLVRKLAFAGTVAMADLVITMGAAYFGAAVNANNFGGWTYPLVTVNHQIVPLRVIFELNCLSMVQLILISLVLITCTGLLLRDHFVTTLVLGIGCVAAGLMAKVKVGWLPQELNPVKWIGLTDYWRVMALGQWFGGSCMTTVIIILLMGITCLLCFKLHTG